MSPLFRAICIATGTLGLLVALEATGAAEVVTGRVEGQPAATAPVAAHRGYVQTRVTAAAESPSPAAGLAVFLRVKESFPLKPVEPSVIALKGLRLVPSVVSCAVDGQVQIRNEDRQPATFLVEDEVLGVLPPGEVLTYECTAGTRGDELRTVRIREWPRVRGAVYVGEVGAAGAVDEKGRFKVEVAEGTYVLRVISLEGVLHEQDVEARGRARDVGVIELESGASR